MRSCNKCGIILPFGSKLDLPRSYRAGCICRICYKYDKREKAITHYHTSYDKSLRNLEPDKKVCTECSETFWSAYSFKVTCCDDCQKNRKNRLQREGRLNAKQRKIKSMARCQKH